MSVQIKTTAPDGSYGPFHFLSMIVVKDGVASVEPQMQAGGHYELVVDGADVALEFVAEPAPAPEPAKEEPAAEFKGL